MTLILSACQGPAVIRGQRDISNDILPLACLTVGVDGRGWALERVVFENAKTHSTAEFVLNKSFDSSHPDYPTAVEGNRYVLCMAIVHLQPGDYCIQTIEFSPHIEQGVATTRLNFDSQHGFRFSVSAGAANYLGTLYVTPDWRQVGSVFQPTREGSHGQFSAGYRIAQSGPRDKKWAEDVIPAMAKAPSVFGHLEQF